MVKKPTDANIDQNSERISQYIYPGGFFFGDYRYQINTLLGSCIAITLWHPILRIGGMCHFVLPSRTSNMSAYQPVVEPDGKYADEALVLFERESACRGTQLKQYQGKIFGGGAMYSNPNHSSPMHSGSVTGKSIGLKNAAIALHLLADRGVTIMAAHIGKTGHRCISFNIDTGDVWVRHEPLKDVLS